MKVYRLCEQSEIENILNSKNFDEIGGYFQNNAQKNNHDYNSGQKYIHFFQDISGILYLEPSKGKFICCYNIPDIILNQRRGIGIYPNYVNKEDNLVPEFAIETELLKMEYLSKVDRIIQDINYKDLFFNPYFKGLIENVYNKESTIELFE